MQTSPTGQTRSSHDVRHLGAPAAADEPKRRPLLSMKRSPSSAGLTLIEVMVVVAIAAMLLAAVVVSVSALTGARARATLGELGATARALYDTAALTGHTCRMVFDLPAGE
jgi:prepilin-type N-terminal cleavage/methylation domain-containing protein